MMLLFQTCSRFLVFVSILLSTTDYFLESVFLLFMDTMNTTLEAFGISLGKVLGLKL